MSYGERDENVVASGPSLASFIALGAKRQGCGDWAKQEDGWILVMICTRFTPLEIETGEC